MAKKRAAEEESSSSSVSSSSSSSDDAYKRAKSTLAADISEHLICSITQELPVDPVLAEDGHTYERAAITQWIATKSTSPIDDNCPLDASRLISNISAKQQIEHLVASGELDDELCADYTDRKYKLSPEYAQELFDEGKVEEAAKLGHAEAQGLMADRCFRGTHDVTKDPEECM